METWGYVQPLMKKVFDAIKTSEEAERYFRSFSWRKRGSLDLSYEAFADAACNHLFYDHPEVYGITEHDGHVIRAYLHNNMGVSKDYNEMLEKI
jgi:hypothetical protein